jgi:2-polyprenyl-3-methyl-5-hydroxy-6-metoxy-1,4-benzoquinol methylase
MLHYGDMYAEDKYARARIMKYADIIAKECVQAKSLLDIGCYTGELVAHLPRTINYFGIDFDAEAIKVARAKGLAVERLDFDNNKLNFDRRFDIIVLTEILEHLVAPKKLLSQIPALLNPGGFVLVSLPNENTIYHRLMSLCGAGVDMHAFKVYKHLHLPTITQSRQLVSQYLKVIRQDYYINPSARSSRLESLGSFFILIPDCVWVLLANLFPGLFARGVIFLCIPKNNTDTTVNT